MNDKKIKKCRHKTQLMTDFLAGELSDKDQKTFEKRLESCAACRAKFAELEATWKLTTEMLKTSEVGSLGNRRTAEQGILNSRSEEEEKKEKNIPRRQGYGGQVEHSTSNVQHRMEEEDRKEKQSPNHQITKSSNVKKKASKFGEVWQKYDLTSKASDFKVLEIAASFILVLIALGVFLGGYSLSSKQNRIQRLGGGYDEEKELSVQMVQLKPIEIARPPEPPEVPTASSNGTSGSEELVSVDFYSKAPMGKPKRRYSSKRKYKRSKPRTAPASVASPEISADPGSLSRSTSSGRKISVKHYAKKKPKSTPRLAPKPEAKRRQKFYKSRQASKSLKLNNVQLAETEDELGQETQKVAKLEEEVKKLHKRTADLMGGPVEPVEPARKSNGFGFGSTIVNAPAKPTPGLPKRKAEKELKGRPVFRIGVAQREKVRKQAAADDGDDDFLADEDEGKAMNFADAEGEDGVEEVAEEIGKDEKDRDAISFKWAKDTDKKAKEIPTLGDMPVLGNALTLDKSQNPNELLKRRDELERKLVEKPYVEKTVHELKENYKKLRKIGLEQRKKDLGRPAEVQWKWSEAVLPLPAKMVEHKEPNYIVLKNGKKLVADKITKDKNGTLTYAAQGFSQKIRSKDYLYARVDGKKIGGKPKSKLQKKLDSIVVKNIDFTDVNIQTVIRYLAEESKRLDKERMGVNMGLGVTDEDLARIPTVTMKLQNIPLSEVIRYLCQSTDLKYNTDGEVLIIGKTLSNQVISGNKEDVELRKKLDGIIIDHMEFEDASVAAVLNLLRVRSKDLDPKREGVNITLRDIKKYSQGKTVTMMLDDISVYEALRNICILSDMKYRVGKDGIVVAKTKRSLNMSAAIQTKILKANLKLWDMKTAKGVADFLAKHKINVGAGSYEIEGGSVKFKLPAAEMEKVEKLFFELNETEDKMKAVEQGLPFLRTKQKPFSTFSIDVDTASYTRVAKEIKQGKRPSSDAVRPEEFINYFDYHYRSPMDAIFGVNLEAAPSNFRPMNTTLRIGVQGKRLGSEVKRPSALTILIDTSGSMANKNRLELVKQSIPMLLSQLRAKDQVSVISCGSSIKQIVSRRSASKKSYIENAVNNIEPLGVTNLEKGIIFAYQMAARNYVAGGYNRVLIFTDGISNVSKASADEILKQIETARQKGITNTVLSVGGDGDDALLEGIADKGDGSYVFLENAESAKDLFENQFSARFREIARDVKIQVEFNPKWVREYRQVGYDNRQLAKSDFRNDKVDAGEVGAGQSVTALYELKINRIMPLARKAQTSIYPPPDMTIATVRIRYKRADNLEIEEHEFPYRLQDIMPSYNSTSPSFQLASAVAEFAENLKYPETKGIANYNTIRRALRPLLSTTYANDKKVRELDNLVRLAK